MGPNDQFVRMKYVRRKKKCSFGRDSEFQIKLEEILSRLKQDQSLWHFRRSLFMNKIIAQNLIPNLIHGKGNRRLIGTTIRILQELMTPVECLIPSEGNMESTEGQMISLELEKAIASTKELFLDTRVTKCLLEFVDEILQTKSMSLSDCEMINHCLILIRNLFHVQRTPSEYHESDHQKSTCPGKSSVSNSVSNQTKKDFVFRNEVLIEDQIMWNLFAQRLDNILIQLLTCQQQHLWNVRIVQLVSLMYREQHQDNIRKLIHEWFELSLCESSTDDENNTLSSSSYDAVSTSDPVSDYSESLSPVDGKRCTKVKPTTLPSASDKNSSSSQIVNTTSSKDSGIGRSSSNNEGETSVDESIQEWSTQHLEKLENVTYNHEHIDIEIKERELLIKNKENLKLTEGGNSKKEINVNEETYSEKILHHVRSIFDTRGIDMTYYSQSVEPKNSSISIDNQQEPPKIEDFKNINSPTRAKTKKPPNENESYSGDSSEKPPPHSLPKLVKGKVLLPGHKRLKHCMSQKMMNETQEMQDMSNSTCSDCDDDPQAKRPSHQKPHKMLVKPRPTKLIQKAIQERNMKRTKIIKRKESCGIKAKALLHHKPTPEDISNLLKEFTIDFMLNGYSTLVQGLRMQVLLPFQIQLDKSHLLWLITYFLRFAVELDLELSQICPVLSVEVVSYLVYEGVIMQEELEIALRKGVENILPYVRRLHLVVTALREFFVSFDICLKKDSSAIDVRQLNNIKNDIGNLVELRQIFVFLIRKYRPGVLTLNYLEDLITANHRFLITQEASQFSDTSFDMVAHIKQFATMDIMQQYGRVLENFNENSDMVNDCIFTMMHHIAGDLRAINVLLQPSILKVFLRIWKEDFELCVDWADLIEYVLRKCTMKSTNKFSPINCNNAGKSEDIQLTIEDVDQLFTLYSSFTEQDLLEKIKDICCDDSIEKPVKKEVIQKLLARGYISSTECTKLCAEIPQTEPTLNENSVKKRPFNEVSIIKSDGQKSDIVGLEDAYMINIDQDTCYQETSETESIHEAKRFCPIQDILLKNEIEIMDSDYLDHKFEASSLKTLGSSIEATINSDEVKKEDENDRECTERSLIAQLIDQIHDNGLENHIRWLQTEILEACHAKMKIINPSLPLPEPLLFYFAISSQPMPIVPWTTDQEEALSSPFFTQLLRALGFHLPSDYEKIFPRLPSFWGPEVLYEIAQKLGSLEEGTMRVSLQYIHEMVHQLKMLNIYVSNSQDTDYEYRCYDMCDLNSSLDCDDSPERVSDCSMQNNRSTSASPISFIDELSKESQCDMGLSYSLEMENSHLHPPCDPVAIETNMDSFPARE